MDNFTINILSHFIDNNVFCSISWSGSDLCITIARRKDSFSFGRRLGPLLRQNRLWISSALLSVVFERKCFNSDRVDIVLVANRVRTFFPAAQRVRSVPFPGHQNYQLAVFLNIYRFRRNMLYQSETYSITKPLCDYLK
jgi:hypothetical protein